MNKSSWKFVACAYLVGVLLTHAAVFWNAHHLIRKGYPDFTIYYSAGTMVREGLGHHLYEESTLFASQRRFAPDVSIRERPLPFNHPSFEALVFVPFTLASYLPAFVLWDFLSLGTLVLSLLLLRGCLKVLDEYSLTTWTVAALAFFPVFVDLLQGQDSILLLCSYTLAYRCLKQQQDALAGLFLALGLFKPQLVLPFVLLWLAQSHMKILWGFLPTAAGLSVLSAVVVGWEGWAAYPRYVLHMEQSAAGGAIRVSDMPNLRGLLSMILPSTRSAPVVILAISTVILLCIGWLCRVRPDADSFESRFAITAVATVFVSYHCLSHDLSVLVLPVAISAAQLRSNQNLGELPKVILACALGLLFLSPMYLLLLTWNGHLALVGWVVLLLMTALALQLWMQRRSGPFRY